MKAAVLIVLSLSALAFAGPAFNSNNQNQIEANNKAQQQYNQQHMTTGSGKQTQATEILKQWCFSSQMSQPELTASFKKLVSAIKSSPEDQDTEAAVMNKRICQGSYNNLSQKSQNQKGQETGANQKDQADAQAHELIKDVYMDALIACEKRECTQQLLKIINSNNVDTIRASYYMTRIAVTEKDSIKDVTEIKQLADSFINDQQQSGSDAIERQKLFAVTSLIGKSLKGKQDSTGDKTELKQVAEQVAKVIVERYIKPVSQQEVQQYQQQQPQQQSPQVAKKIAKRNAALKALNNIPAYAIKDDQSVQEAIIKIAQDKQEQNTARQSAIEILEENESATQKLKQIAFDQDEPIEVRVAAYRALMTTKQQTAEEIVDQTVKHIEDLRNQQQDDQFVLYAISHLDNIRTTQQPEYQHVKESLNKNKQHYMQVQLLQKKFKQQLNDIRRSSRNYKLEQDFNQLESGLVIEGDLVYESQNKQQQQQFQVLPKLVRVNMSMPVMGETVNVVEITLRQNQMDEQFLSALKIAQGAKFNSESVSKVVDSFRSSVEQQQQKQQQQQHNQQRNQYSNNNEQQNAEADLTIKVDGTTVVYLSVDDFKTGSRTGSYGQQRSTRSINSYSVVDDVIEYLKRNPLNFNRGFNFNVNERLAKVLDIDANLIAGLRFNSRATGQAEDFEIVGQVEPRLGVEAIVGPAKMSSKKLLQRFSTKTAVGFRLRFKQNELLDVQVDLPMNNMELFTVETQLVEKSNTMPYSYNYLPESIYGQEDIYTPTEDYMLPINEDDDQDYTTNYRNNKYQSDEDRMYQRRAYGNNKKAVRTMKRSIFEQKQSVAQSIAKFVQGKSSTFAQSLETPEDVARATGLRGKLRVVASPKDMSFVVSATVQKYEPSMQGYRVKVQKIERGQEQTQYLLQVSTPGSRTDRTMQVRLFQQENSQRTIVKSEIQSPSYGASAQYELIHDGRVYAIKADVASTRGKQWRHSVEAGVQRSQQGARIGSNGQTIKPYLSIQSTSLARPVQLQGYVSYQQSPKSVITYEFKNPNSGDYLQGKIIADQRSSSSYARSGSLRRSMQSPIELVLGNDLTFTNELVAQVQEQAVKVHNMLDWDSNKWSVNADTSASHKNLRKPDSEKQVLFAVKLNKDQQSVTVQRKSPQQERKEFRAVFASEFKAPNTHQMIAEYRYNGKHQSGLQSVVAYKHKVDVQQESSKKYNVAGQLELVDTERQINEKLAGRARISTENKMKSVQAEMSSRAKQVKVDAEYKSIEEQKVDVMYFDAEDRTQHKTQMRSDKRQFSLQSRTDKRNQMLAKLVLEVLKQQGEVQFVVELPTEQTHVAADLKLAGNGKLSSLAVQTPRFASKGEFSFETMQGASSYGKRIAMRSSPFFARAANFHFKNNIKDNSNQEDYFFESAYNGLDYENNDSSDKKSYFRFGSPAYRSDFEFNPRDETSKFGLYARSKRAANQYDYYSNKDSSLLDLLNYDNTNKINLANKLWLVRSVVSSPRTMEGLKQKARRALFEYADKRQSNKHYFNYEPSEDRFQFGLEREPTAEYYGKSGAFGQSMRLVGDINTNRFQDSDFDFEQSNKSQDYNKKIANYLRQSKLALESEFVDFDFNSKPYDGQESYHKLSAVSRHRRSPFKKHDSELRYQKNQGYKASVKHENSDETRHSFQAQADESPKKWAKMSYESDKHGKTDYEHNWRRHAKRSHYDADKYEQQQQKKQRQQDEQEYYQNKVYFAHQNPRSALKHQTSFDWEEPKQNWAYTSSRTRRSVSYRDAADFEAQRRYGTIDYLKHVKAHLNSQTTKNNADFYNVDFDYQPSSHARLNVNMPEDMLHQSSFEYEPNERLYKLQSKLYNQKTQVPSYELSASTKPIVAVAGLATSEQEPAFFNNQHQMFEQQYARYPYAANLVSKAFQQPLKFDYSDKYGRVARFDYDQSPLSTSAGTGYAGLRQKRAAVYYKDQSADLEHESTYDFYPEVFVGKMKSSMKRYPGDMIVKAQTKYGPIVVRADSTYGNGVELELESPLVDAKLTTNTENYRGASLIKIQVDNKQQKVKLTKIVRQFPVIKDSKLVQEFAQKFDSARFEQQTELLVSLVDAIFKVKSQTMLNQHKILIVEGEYNKQQEKAYIKIDGERANGRAIIDLATKSAELVLDDKHNVQHYTRLTRQSDKFYSLDSQTTVKGKPVYKLNGKISSIIFSEPEHFFSRRARYGSSSANEEHISTIEAVVYEPKQMQIKAKYDCLKKEARVIVENVEERKVQQTVVKFDDDTQSILVDSRLSSPYGQIYTGKAKINVPGLLQSSKCYRQSQLCQSNFIYSDKSGNYMAKYMPGEYASVDTPYLKQTFNMSY